MQICIKIGILVAFLSLSPSGLYSGWVARFINIEPTVEYAELMPLDDGGYALLSQAVAHDDTQSLRLALDEEDADPDLIEIINRIEGDDSFFVFVKGSVHGLVSLVSGKESRGGSPALLSAAGIDLNLDASIYQKSNFIQKIWLKIKEASLAGSINSKGIAHRNKYALNRLCSTNLLRGCTLTSVVMFKRRPNQLSFREKVMLAATIYRPLAKRNAEKLAQKSMIYCKSYFSSKLADCHFSSGEFKERLNLLTISRRVVAHRPTYILQEKKLKLINRMEKRMEHFAKGVSTEIAIGNIHNNQSIFISNSGVVRKRGFDQRPIASVSKLLTLLAKDLTVDEELIHGMRTSRNNIIQKKLEAMNPINVESIINTIHDNNINIHFDMPSSTIPESIANGSIGLTTHDLLKTLLILGNRVKDNHDLKELATASVSIGKNGERGTGISILDKTLKTQISNKYLILAAKTGTLASRSTSMTPGVYGKLFVLVLYRKHDSRIIPISIRIYPDDLQSPICQAEGCISHKYLAGLLKEAIVLIDDL